MQKPDAELVRRLGLELSPRRFWTRGKIVAAALLVLVLAAGTGVYVWRSEGPTAYVTAPVTSGPLTVTVSATGTLQPQDQVEVGAEISGRVDAVNVDFNDRVSKGQVIAVINTDQIRAQLAQAQAALNAARATVINNEATVKETFERRNRARAFSPSAAYPPRMFKPQRPNMTAPSPASPRQKPMSRTPRLWWRRIRPRSARRRCVRPSTVWCWSRASTGQTVAASFQTPVLFTLASDLSMMQLAVDIDEADIGLARGSAGELRGRCLSATPPTPHRPLRNSPKSANGVVTYEGLDRRQQRRRCGRPTATAKILVSETKDAMLVPNGALRFTPPAKDASPPPLEPATNGELKGRVWVLDGKIPVLRDLRIGRSDGRNTEVLSGDLKPGMRVITDIVNPTNGA